MQVKAKAHCRGIGRRAYTCINTHLLLPLGWGNYMHLVYKNSMTLYFTGMFFSAGRPEGLSNPKPGSFRLLLPCVPRTTPLDPHTQWLLLGHSPECLVLSHFSCGYTLHLSEACLPNTLHFIPSNLGLPNHLLSGPSCPITFPVFTNSSPGSCFQWHLQ